jgi:hypothetical protein
MLYIIYYTLYIIFYTLYIIYYILYIIYYIIYIIYYILCVPFPPPNQCPFLHRFPPLSQACPQKKRRRLLLQLRPFKLQMRLRPLHLRLHLRSRHLPLCIAPRRSNLRPLLPFMLGIHTQFRLPLWLRPLHLRRVFTAACTRGAKRLISRPLRFESTRNCTLLLLARPQPFQPVPIASLIGTRPVRNLETSD